LNTAVKIKSVKFDVAKLKNIYNLTRQKNHHSNIFVIEENDFPNRKKELGDEQKKEKKKIQCSIKVFQKRLEDAIKKNKPKSIKTNEKNLDEAKKKLAKFDTFKDEREKHFVEFTIALTNSRGEKYHQDWATEAVNFFKSRYPKMEVISAAEHRDQHSPHLHLLMYSKDTPVTQVLANDADTSKEIMKEAYSKIANEFNTFAKFALAPQIAGLVRGKKYVSLRRFKKHGNKEATKNKLKENEENERRIRTENRTASITDIRARISSSHGEIEKQHAEVAEAVRDEQKIGELGDQIESATNLLRRFADTIKRITELFGGRNSRVEAKVKSEEQKLVDAVLAKNAQKRATEAEKRKTHTNPHRKP
jgi:hypothetical protein